jgi:hypothetical protein
MDLKLWARHHGIIVITLTVVEMLLPKCVIWSSDDSPSVTIGMDPQTPFPPIALSDHFPWDLCIWPNQFPHSICFNPEDGGSTILLNVGTCLPKYIMLHPRRPQFESLQLNFKNFCILPDVFSTCSIVLKLQIMFFDEQLNWIYCIYLIWKITFYFMHISSSDSLQTGSVDLLVMAKLIWLPWCCTLNWR